MRKPIEAVIGGTTYKLQLTGQTFEDADAEGVDLLSLLDGEAVKPANVCTFLYWAARTHHPEVKRSDFLSSVDFRDLPSLAPVAVSLIRSDTSSASDGDGAGEPEGAAT